MGASSAGSVIANRLTEDPAVRVLVLEAGVPDPNIHAPAGWPATWQTERDRAIMTAPKSTPPTASTTGRGAKPTAAARR